ncbi:hypothetical protein N8739_02810, partial [Luminiphilus sp.]|nr:hypothetical protein [Luminiphilus sp.]
MRLLAFLLLLLPTLSLAQGLHTFKNGEVADAEKINQNFNYVLENASGGCTVEQVDNTAEITCADGSSAVVPGYGTVVVYPEGLEGEAAPTEYNTGQIVAYDANDVVLGEVKQATGSGPLLYLDRDPDDVNNYRTAMLWQNHESQTIVLTGTINTGVWFLDDACQGSPFSQYKEELIRYGNSYFVADFDQVGEQLLFKSYRRPAFDTYEAQDCISADYVNTGFLPRP